MRVKICNQCPRRCAVSRERVTGFCQMPSEIRLARVALHPWEEPCLSGKNGSGTVFFCGCNLRCVFCQNRTISHDTELGRVVSDSELADLMLSLQARGAANINLVTPTHYVHRLVPILRAVRPQLTVPVVYNCGGYESVEALRALEGLIDVYLPDVKYFDSALSARYSQAPDYFSVTTNALEEMLRQRPKCVYDGDGSLLSGVMVRHLVLPGCRADSVKLLRALAERFGSDAFPLSLMSQYTPDFAPEDADANLRRRLTTFEYDFVLRVAQELGFEGYLQQRNSATSHYTPDFSESTF